MKDIRETEETRQHLPTHQEIERRAHELYLKREGRPGRDVDDWLAAEAELTRERQMESGHFELGSRTTAAGGSTAFGGGTRSLK